MDDQKHYEMGDPADMAIRDAVPAYHVLLLPAEVARLKARAEEHARQKGLRHAGEHWEGTYLAAWGFWYLVHEELGKWITYDAEEPNPLLLRGDGRWPRIRIEGEELWMRVRFRHHREFLAGGRYFGRKLVVFDSVDQEPPDYLVPATVLSHSDGSSSVGFFGVVSRDIIEEERRKQTPRPPSGAGKGGSANIPISADRFDAARFSELLANAEPSGRE